ncbi:MAG TPA: LytTR family DNA-binding domain-containing protein [Candidatus Eremiobacteraceae bacterium]|nr:LytTR family DNA-binding domain-containing protein [Candidatus Eremiobacteraceae bacterium]
MQFVNAHVADQSIDTLVSSVSEPLQAPANRGPVDAGLIATPPLVQMLARQMCVRIAIKTKGRILLIDPADIITVEAKGNYVLLRHTLCSHMLRESISNIEEKLIPHGFVRIHRSVLVNSAFVVELQPWSTGEYILLVKGGGRYRVTRTYKKNLQLLAESWIGTNGFFVE